MAHDPHRRLQLDHLGGLRARVETVSAETHPTQGASGLGEEDRTGGVGEMDEWGLDPLRRRFEQLDLTSGELGILVGHREVGPQRGH